MTQGQLLGDIFRVLVESKVCPETTLGEWVPRLLYLHNKGWLYASDGADGKVLSVAAAYRIPAIEKRYLERMPVQEDGNILYIPFYASRKNGHRLTALRLLKSYLKQNKENVHELYFERFSEGGKSRRFSINRGKLHGKS